MAASVASSAGPGSTTRSATTCACIGHGRSAVHHGALVAATPPCGRWSVRPGGVGAGSRTRLTAPTGLRASVVVNATGPGRQDARARGLGATPLLQPTRACRSWWTGVGSAHREVIVSPARSTAACCSILPWGNLAYIGITDTDTSESPDQLPCRATTSSNVLRSATHAFPTRGGRRGRAGRLWAGSVRSWSTRERQERHRVCSREHVIVYGAGGMISVVVA